MEKKPAKPEEVIVSVKYYPTPQKPAEEHVPPLYLGLRIAKVR